MIPDVKIVEPQVYSDPRGLFMEVWRATTYAEAGIYLPFVQDNHSRSELNTLRGLHYQVRQPQGKLVRVVVGEIYDVAVDLRRSSPTFGRWVAVTLSAANRKLMWIPPGFAHGFFVTGGTAECLYKCSDYYAPEYERTIRWDDPTLGIAWPVPPGSEPILSDKDRDGALFEAAEYFS